MFDQLFDLCRLYGVARWLRQIRIESPAYRRHEDVWVKRYAAEERKGIALLQREMRLENERRELLNRVDLAKELPCDGSQLYILDEKLVEVRQHHCAHQRELRRLWSIKPNGCQIRDFEMTQKPQMTRHDKPYSWFQGRKACAFSGGCCGRECGCCKKPLRMFLTPTLLDPKKRMGIYGHCTTECGCCIKYNGAYIPDTSIGGTETDNDRQVCADSKESQKGSK